MLSWFQKTDERLRRKKKSFVSSLLFVKTNNNSGRREKLKRHSLVCGSSMLRFASDCLSDSGKSITWTKWDILMKSVRWSDSAVKFFLPSSIWLYDCSLFALLIKLDWRQRLNELLDYFLLPSCLFVILCKLFSFETSLWFVVLIMPDHSFRFLLLALEISGCPQKACLR